MTTVHNYKALLAAAETAGREVCDERDQARDALRDAHAALDVEIGRGDKATGRVFTLAERINFALAGLHEETKRGDDAEDKVDRQAREIDRLKADLLLLGALKSEEVAPVIERFRAAFGADVPQAPSGERALTFERAIQIGEKVHGLYPSEAAAVLLAEFGEPAKVVPPVRRARHDRHCMIHDGVGCSREPGCEVEP